MPILRKTLHRPSKRERMRRTDRAFEIVAKVFLVVYALYVIAIWISERPSLHLAGVEVGGVHAVEREPLETIANDALDGRLLWKIKRNNALLYPKRAVATAIARFDARIKNVAVDIGEDRSVHIDIAEYSPAYLWCPPGGVDATSTLLIDCYFADERGYRFAQAPVYSGSPFLTFETPLRSAYPIGSAFLTPEEFARLETFLLHLSAIGLHPVSVREAGMHDFLITTEAPWAIRWRTTEDPEAAVANLKLVVEHIAKEPEEALNIRTIDLRFGNKVFYR